MKQQEKEIEALLRGLETAVGDLDGAVVELDGEEGVDEEMRAWDGELKGV